MLPDPRLPWPGTAINRRYKGRTLSVNVLADGFEYEGDPLGLLSAIAKKITVSHLNGFRFFEKKSQATSVGVSRLL